ncbi:hypothetical protein CFIMG_006445RA [Ceratocystis fimbriata CBS 114723]|uniref:Uncharacterized protein n=1 Tax=Ceratocystis fimbriata CBS 114723 TaxID=1035309 RepID=A0A2C5W6S9_9PEZI|nr:hypothetical protein CFIMG_006445RA [Ceratocystis fimbriata CBS 114723]
MAYPPKPDGAYLPMPPARSHSPTEPTFWSPPWLWNHATNQTVTPPRYPPYSTTPPRQPTPQACMVFPPPPHHTHCHPRHHTHQQHHVPCCGIFVSPAPTPPNNVVVQAEVREVPRWDAPPRHTYKLTLGPSTTVDYLVSAMGTQTAHDIRVHLNPGHTMLLSELRGRHDVGIMRRPGVWFEVIRK